MPDTLTKLAYQTFQQGKSVFSITHKSISDRLWELFYPERSKGTPLTSKALSLLQSRYQQLMEADWRDAERGIYPVNLLFDNPWKDFFVYYPVLVSDMPQTWDRMSNQQYQVLPKDVPTEGYPKYYLRNFHHQTDGYLSDYSANLYDLQVELLFGGSADPMRRRILAPLKQGLQQFSDVPAHQQKVLDVACGTGRTLRMLRSMLPQASLYGTDLSAAYLRKANQQLSELSNELPQIVCANAERLPFLDNYFHGITCVFLFHELPPQARQNVIEEAFRVVQPGGTFVICDSIQTDDSPELVTAMENFPAIFHEPYYANYVQDDLTDRLTKVGFVNISTETHLLSKYWIAHKPNV
ncbi:MAG: class I SAM-dependent methyltransferase [Thainema sp.]